MGHHLNGKWERVTPFILFFCLSLNSCALQYFDPQTGTDHLWGFGHLKMKAAHSQDAKKAVVKEVEIFGVGLGLGEDRNYVVVGWDQQTLLKILDSDSCLVIEWPSADRNLFTARIGAALPFLEILPPECLP